MLNFKKFILNSTDILIYKIIPIWFINTSVRLFGVHIKQVNIAYIKKIVRTQTRVDIFAGYAALTYKKNYLDFKTNWLSINLFLKILTQNLLRETLLQEKVFYIESIYPPPPGGKLLIAGFPVVAIMVENLLYNTRIGFPILQLVTNDVLTLIFFYIGTYKQSLYGV